MKEIIIRFVARALLPIVCLFVVMTAARADLIYVADNGDNTVKTVTIPGGVVNPVPFATSLNFPEGVVFDGSGNLYASNAATSGTNFGRVMKIPPTGGTGSTFGDPFNRPFGLAFDGSGNLFIANFGTGGTVGTPNASNSVIKVDSSGTFVSTIMGAGTINRPSGIAFDTAGNLYVANTGSNTVREYDPVADAQVSFQVGAAQGINGPQGLAIDSSGNVYVANNNDDKILKFTPDATMTPTVTTFATLPAGSSPVGLAFDSSGNLYVANNLSGTISKITPGGVLTTFASSGLIAPTFLAISLGASGVPEPSSLALLGAGTMAFAAYGWRRRKRDIPPS